MNVYFYLPKKKRLVNSIIALALCVNGGCGYGFQGGGSILPPDVKRIYIPRVVNNSTEPNLTQLMTEALQDYFERFGVVSVAASAQEADAILEVKILNVKRTTRLSTAATDTAFQLDASLNIFAELKRVSGQVLWRDPGFTVSKPFGISRSAVVATSADFAQNSLGSGDLSALNERELSRGQEQDALNNIVEAATKQIYDAAVTPDF